MYCYEKFMAKRVTLGHGSLKSLRNLDVIRSHQSWILVIEARGINAPVGRSTQSPTGGLPLGKSRVWMIILAGDFQQSADVVDHSLLTLQRDFGSACHGHWW